jgi:GIY-YIG catalytic domain/NUMOD1 domain
MKNTKHNKTESLFKKEDININTSRIKIKPLIIYNDSLLDKFKALDDNIGKSVVYRWVHKNNKSYVGSSKDLYRRLKDCYYNTDFLNKKKITSDSRIYKALLDDGYESFKLEILEYCDKKNLIEREQYYIDLIKPEYNIQNIAGIVLSPRGSSTTVINKTNGSIKVYVSMYAAAKAINIKYSTIKYYVNKDKLLKGTYLITSKPIKSKRKGCHR